MSNLYELSAELRSDLGKGASRRLRRNHDRVPAILYGAGQEPTALTFDHKQLLKALENEAFYSHILTVNIAGKKERAVLKALQRHPSKPRVTHMDLLRITSNQKITMHVPLHFLNSEIAPGVKKDGGIVSHLMNDVEIRCLPDDLPEYLEVDLANLELNHSIHLSDLKLSKGVEIVALAHGTEHDLPVASIHIPRASLASEEGTAPEAAAASATAETAEKPAD